jgi:Protein of unknown function (DUF4242)
MAIEMPRYVVQRTLPKNWDADGSIVERCRQIVEQNGDDVTWLHSYVSEDGRKWFCAYEAPTPEAIRRSSVRNRLPVDSITSVRVLDPYPYPSSRRDDAQTDGA